APAVAEIAHPLQQGDPGPGHRDCSCAHDLRVLSRGSRLDTVRSRGDMFHAAYAFYDVNSTTMIGGLHPPGGNPPHTTDMRPASGSYTESPEKGPAARERCDPIRRGPGRLIRLTATPGR